MENTQLDLLHREMLVREQDVYGTQEEIKVLNQKIQEGQQAYVFLRDKYVSLIKGMVTSRGLNLTMLKMAAKGTACTLFEQDLKKQNSIQGMILFLKDSYVDATEYERLAMVQFVMNHRADYTAELQRVLLETYRQDIATVRVLLNL